MSLSAIIITKNEEQNIRECLEALQFADEIVLVDSGSSDRTVEFAKQCGAKVHARAFDDFSAQKNFALAHAKNEWILSVDADERVSPELAQEVLRSATVAGPAAYRIPRQTYFLKKRFRFSGTQSDKPVRLFKKNTARFEQPIHEYVAVNGLTGELKNPLLHFTTPSVERERQKIEFYTDIEAQFMKDKSVPSSKILAFAKTCGIFAYHYFWKWGFLDGREGFLFAYFSALYTRRKHQKLSELYRAERLEPQIRERFDAHAVKLPDLIDRSDRRLKALLAACGNVRGKDVLEVGCGKGRFAEVFIEEGAKVTGIDPSPELLKDTRRLQGTFLQASATELPFEDASFDVVIAVEVIEHLPFLETSLREMLRVLRPGGVIALIDRNKFSLNQKRFLVPNVLIKRWHEMKNHWIYPNNFPFRERWFSKGQVLRLLKPCCASASALHVLSDGELRCGWRQVFQSMPATRLFILWRGVKK